MAAGRAGGGLTTSMAAPKTKEDPVRQQLIQALFSDSSSTNSETMLTYVKIYEEEKSGKDMKLLPTVKANGKVRLHKVKKTSATSYHIGRTWHLDEIKSIENVD
ncbi:hypothetical protein EDD11_006492, partial [Mortierella claussenii]